METRKERIKELLEYINENSNGESFFDDLYYKLQKEIDIEKQFNNDVRNNSYLRNLLTTQEKQASNYITARGSKKSGKAYIEFLNHFTYDLLDEY